MRKIFFLMFLVASLNGFGQSVTQTTLKNFFLRGSQPTAAQFASFIDYSYNAVTDGMWDLTGGTSIYFTPYATKQTGKWYQFATAPSDTTTALKFDGILDAARLRVGGIDVLTSMTSDWTSSGGNIYRSSGNVGIGTVSPTYKLHVVGTSYFSGIALFNSYLRIGNTSTSLYLNSGSGDLMLSDANAGAVTLSSLKGTSTNYFNKSGANIYPINTTDNLFVGTTSDPMSGGHKFAVNGKTWLGGATTFNGAATFYGGSLRLVDGAAVTRFSTDGTLAGNSDAYVPTQKDTKTYVDGIWAQSSTHLYNTTDSIGIGTSTITNRLSVKGNMNFTDTLNRIYFGTSNYFGRTAGNSMKWNVGGNDAVSIRSNGFGTDTIDFAGDVLRFNGVDILAGDPGSTIVDSLINNAVLYKRGDTVSGSTSFTWNDTVLRIAAPNANTAIGEDAGIALTSGADNAFLGYNAGSANSTGINNTFLGSRAGLYNTTGYHNTFVGYKAGTTNTVGNFNTFLGSVCGSTNTGSSTAFLGYHAGYYNSSGYSNTFLGTESGFSNTTGYHNVFVGDSAGFTTAGGIENVFLGTWAGKLNASGVNNTFVGHRSGEVNTASYNTFYGHGSGSANTTGQRNLYIGYGAGQSSVGGSYNTFVGYLAGSANNTTGYNTFLGYYSGQATTSGYSNTFLGAYSGYSNSTGKH